MEGDVVFTGRDGMGWIMMNEHFGFDTNIQRRGDLVLFEYILLLFRLVLFQWLDIFQSPFALDGVPALLESFARDGVVSSGTTSTSTATENVLPPDQRHGKDANEIDDQH
jgi:hypothetical protein